MGKSKEKRDKENKGRDNKNLHAMIEDPQVIEHVNKMAWHYYRLIRAEKRGLITIEDLISAGFEGVIVAAGKYKPGAKASFKAYSTDWIRGEMIREMIFYVGKDALLIDDVDKMSVLCGRNDSADADDMFDISDIPPEEQLEIITSKLAEYHLAKVEISVYLAVNGIGCDKVTNLKALGRQLNKREMEIRRIRQSAEDKVKRGLIKEEEKRKKRENRDC